MLTSSNSMASIDIVEDDEEETAMEAKVVLTREWNRAFLLVCVAGLFVDPLFFYALSISGQRVCLFLDGWFVVTATALRCMIDAVHVCNMWLRLSAARRGRRRSVGEVAVEYLRSKEGFFLDFLVILPLLQGGLWIIAPEMIRRGSTMSVMTVMLIMFLFQYLPKIYHSLCLLRRMRNSSGYIFGAVWWGISLNLIAYFVASHAIGACWYLLGIQRATKCLRMQCMATKGCELRTIGCAGPIYYGRTATVEDGERLAWAKNLNVKTTCLDSSDNFEYGAYQWTVDLITNTNRLEKILLPIFWGLMTLSTFGILESTTEWPEIVFNIIILTIGLLLVTTLIGNIKIFLQTTTTKKQSRLLRMRSLEWWMRRRQLPRGLRQRVRQFERQHWAAVRGVDESKMIQNFPDGLRRDIKYHLCLDLVRQVPLFQHMDDLVLENICDRVKSLVIPKGETIAKEGDPVNRMMFIVRGHLQNSQVLRDGVKSCCMLGPGNFTGDELLSWCLRRPFIERLPPSSSTLVTLEAMEAFGLEAGDVKYVTQHFRYIFTNEKVKRSARYYSPGWRTWAAVAIQLAWRRHKHRLTLASLSSIRPPPRPASRCSSPADERLRHYTVLLTSPKPHRDEFSA